MTMTDDLLPEDCLDELHREHEVALRLIERLEALGNALNVGRTVDAAEVREGVSLLDRYLHRLHASRFDAGLIPDAEKVAMAECFPHLDEITANHNRMQGEEPTLEQSLSDYAAGESGAASTLALLLLTVTGRDREAIQYEEDYPLSCLPNALTRVLKADVDGKFAVTDAELRRLESEIDRYLACPTGHVLAATA